MRSTCEMFRDVSETERREVTGGYGMYEPSDPREDHFEPWSENNNPPEGSNTGENTSTYITPGTD